MSTVAAPTLVEPETDDFWARLGIFPGGLTERDQRDDLERKTRLALRRLGVGNLRFLCDSTS